MADTPQTSEDTGYSDDETDSDIDDGTFDPRGTTAYLPTKPASSPTSPSTLRHGSSKINNDVVYSASASNFEHATSEPS